MVFIESNIDFKLRSQIPDSAQSISANISEGYGRRSVSRYIQFVYYALGLLAETMARSIGLTETNRISAARFHQFDLHYGVENRLVCVIEKLEHKRDDEDWIARISEDPEEYLITPPLHDSITPSLHYSTTPSSTHA